MSTLIEGTELASPQGFGEKSRNLPFTGWGISQGEEIPSAADKVKNAHDIYLHEEYRGFIKAGSRWLRIVNWSGRHGFENTSRRLRDVVVAGTMLTVLSPLIALTALLIKLDSPGPVLFRQKRVGKHGQLFTIYKFRSMVTEAEELKLKLAESNEVDQVYFKIKNDPRMTRIGRIIRKSSIDELPQLINVLRGDMSTVGPRPALAHEVEELQFEHLRRLDVSPGMTGLQQISGRSNVGFEQWMYFDSEYVDGHSLAKDVEILLKTIPAVISGKGAY
jgi:lipopolysaccharide/colanic/teichoic acid biosynthesis glycosyltransferase